MKNVFDTLRITRRALWDLLDGHSLATINYVPGGFNNNLLWNFAHVVVSQQLLVYRPSGLPLCVEDQLVEKFRRGTKPDGKSTSTEVEHIRQLGFSTIDQMEADYNAGKFTAFELVTTGIGARLETVEDAIRFVNVHDGMHLGYSMALKRMLG